MGYTKVKKVSDYLAQYDGKIGIANVSFSPGSEREQSTEVEFPA